MTTEIESTETESTSADVQNVSVVITNPESDNLKAQLAEINSALAGVASTLGNTTKAIKTQGQEIVALKSAPPVVPQDDGLKADFDGLKSTLGEIVTGLGVLSQSAQSQAEEINALKSAQTNLPQPHAIKAAPLETDEGDPETKVYRDIFVKKLTGTGFSNEQNDAFKAYMTAPSHLGNDATQYALKVGLADPTCYEYEYEPYPDGYKIKGERVSPQSRRLVNIKSFSPPAPQRGVKAISSLTPSAGGILVPIDHLRELIQKRDEESIVRRMGAMTRTTMSQVMEVPSNDTMLGKFIDTAELASITEDTPTYTPGQLGIRTFSKITRIGTRTLADQVVNVVSDLMRQAGLAQGITENEQFLVGAGDGLAGIQGAIASRSSGVTTATNAAITFAEAMEFVNFNARYLSESSAFAMNKTTETYLRTIETSGPNPMTTVFNSNSGPVASLGNLLGFSLSNSYEIAEIATTAKVAIGGDWSRGYLIGERMGMEVQVLREKYADTGEIGYVWNYRNGGISTIDEALWLLIMAV